MKITEKEYNIQTGKETITEREETAGEKASREQFEAELAQKQAEAKANADVKAALLNKLGISEEEARLLLS